MTQESGEQGKQLQDFCYFEFGVKNKDASLCNKMNFQYQQYCPPCGNGNICAPCPGPKTKEECLAKSS